MELYFLVGKQIAGRLSPRSINLLAILNAMSAMKRCGVCSEGAHVDLVTGV